MVPYSLQTQILIVVAVVTLHNYIRREAHRDWLFKKYDDDEMIVIDEEEDMLVEFMASHLTSEMDLFRDSLAIDAERTKLITFYWRVFVLLYDGWALFSSFAVVVNVSCNFFFYFTIHVLSKQDYLQKF